MGAPTGAVVLQAAAGAASRHGAARRPAPGPVDPWAVEGSLLLGVAVSQVVSALVGSALGLLPVSSPLAIVTHFVAPTALALLAVVDPLSGPRGWVDLASLAPLTTPGASDVDAAQWGRIAVATAAWGVLPLLAGVARPHRRELA